MSNKYKEFINDWPNQKNYAKWLIKYTTPYLPSMALLMGFNILASLSSVGMAFVQKKIIDTATTVAAQHSSAVSSAISTVLPIIGIYILIVIGMLIVNVQSQLISSVVNEKFAFGIRKQVYEKILHSSWEKVSAYHTGDLMTRLTSDTGTIASGISSTIPSIITLIVDFAAAFIAVFTLDPTLALIALLLGPVAVLITFILGRKLKKLQVKVQETESEYRSFITESLSNLMIIKAFCNEDYASNRLTELRNNRLHWILKKNRMNLAASTAMSGSFQLGYLIAFSWGAYQIATNGITYGDMSVFLTLFNKIQAPILALATTVPQVISILASAGRVIELQNLPLEPKEETHLTPEQVGIKVDSLTFGYNEENIFQNAGIDIKPGEFIAIVGESGIGKTTLIRLMMSFINSPNGLIEFYNTKGETELTNGGSREFISYVPQGNTLFSGTIAENVRMGNQNASNEEILEALKASSAYGFVEKLPNGIETRIGERGHGLSEGQAQRVALARALVRQAPFLVLDEATSSLDEKTELAVLENIRKLQPAPTCILITHRRSVLAYCDREIKIEDKKIYEMDL